MDGLNGPRVIDPEKLDAQLIADGHDPACVRWVCEEHNRHCINLGESVHDVHGCTFCVTQPSEGPVFIGAHAHAQLTALASKWDARSMGNVAVDDPWEYSAKLAYRECAEQLGKIIGMSRPSGGGSE